MAKKWFEDGLTSDGLKKAYRELAKKYHPDMPTGDLEAMKQINDQYDSYFERLTVKVENGFDFWDIFNAQQKAREEAEKSREFIIFMVKNQKSPGQVVGIKWETSFFGSRRKQLFFPDVSWKDAQVGPARCKVSREASPGCYIVTGENLTLEVPNWKQMAEFVQKEMCDFQMDNAIHYVEEPYGNFYMNRYGTEIYAILDGKFLSLSLHNQGTIPFTVKDSLDAKDFPFIAYQDCSFAEFCKYHDVDCESQFHHSLQMQPMTADASLSPTISYMVRKGMLKLFQSRLDHTMKYGFFDSKKLIPHLNHLSIEDIEEVQDYLDVINPQFDEKVKAKIRKGKLKVII